VTLRFDHLVLLTADLDQAVEDFRSLGFTVTARADTSHGSTAFRFISFADGSYVLLTAFTSADAATKHRLGPVMAAGGGWADYSLVVPSAAAVGATLAAKGLPVAGPVEVANVLAGGERWGLDLLMTGRGAGGDPALPFLVSDREGRRHRIPGPSDHANGATGIVSVAVASADPARAAAALAAMGGEAVPAAAPGEQAVRFGAGRVDVRPVAPGGREGLVEAVLAAAAPGLPAAGRALDIGLSHGAPIRLVAA
jgi:catechol 2,3-dioxygenase-like lactoylglutathione lyase family enzyme